MTTPPFLTISEREQYLYDRSYFEPGSVIDQHRTRLADINFHYFLGYARNYRALVGRNQISVAAKVPDDVFGVIDLDAKVACLIHEGLRAAEWRLRSATVRHYCDKYPSCGSYLRVDQYVATEVGGPDRLVASLLQHIYRHDEPYVDEFLAAAALASGVEKPRRYETAVHDRCAILAADLPLWSVVDSLSLGLLGQFIMLCDKDTSAPVWKEVAKDLGIGAQVFPTQVKSLAYLRNSVAHHARLWMRPTLDSAKKPRMFASRLRDAHSKSMFWAFMNLATFLPANERHSFAQRLDDLTKENPIYRHGITHVHETPKKP